MMARADSNTHIPPVVKQLAPYVRSRQEVLQIRQALTSYLRSFIVFDESNDNPQSHLSLCAPTGAVADVSRIPPDLPGLRKDYLKALAANVTARKEFAAATDNVASLRRQRTSPNLPCDDDLQEPGADLRDYLALLRDRRRHNKLQVFQQYLGETRARDTSILGENGHEGEQISLPEVEVGQDGNGTSLDELVHSLERAVVRAKSQLDRQKQLFEKAKAQHDSRSETSPVQASPEAKAQALHKTRDELVQWVEERLVGQGDPDESLLQELPPEEIEAAQQELADCKAQIAEQYAAYIQARRELLEAASRACQPVNVAPKPSTRPNKAELVPVQVPPPNAMDVLSYATENLVPLSKGQKSLSLQRSYLSGLLSKEKSTTLRALNRLSDESHLLPEYPISSQQTRLKHNNNFRSQVQPEQSADEVVNLAEAWAFAADAAGANGREYVQQKLALGTEVAQDARQTLIDVYGTLNQDLDEVMDGQKRDVSISTRLRGGSRVEKRPNGPWSRLNGKVGVE
ncbi:hypothetical protein MYU51_019831 [Penicillium brevicompactum]|uniref:uncharacterized protein n=1 Tax=Penicillium brevicompactum TaxID=5074 RepID=UPI00253FF86C|nr:uncharacterized protein N7506_000381 [Penicillium brevicompactum]KAJ5347128.1 hypothetical protein N7506_000381 [Penicillium brevicompactum]